MSDGKTAGTSVAEKVDRDRALLRFDRLRSLRESAVSFRHAQPRHRRQRRR